jgi:hypothetical protein
MTATLTATTAIGAVSSAPVRGRARALFLCVEELSRRRYTRAIDRWKVCPATAE